MFTTRLTYDGFCCAFNYVKFTDDLLNNKEYKLNQDSVTTDSGIENGLYVAIKNNVQDYYYTTISSVGVIVDIFAPTDYPDKTSGSLTEILTHPNSENFIEIVPTVLTSVRDVSAYSVEKRKCIFDSERLTSFGTTYSQSDCNIDCRTTSMLAMCQCIPFIIPLSNKSNVCTLADISCLNRYKEKWTSLYPEDMDVRAYLQKEKQNSLRCDNKCHPPCGDIIVYEAQANAFPILSNFGGIFGIFVGWSLIFIIQLFPDCLRKIKEKVVIIS